MPDGKAEVAKLAGRRLWHGACDAGLNVAATALQQGPLCSCMHGVPDFAFLFRRRGDLAVLCTQQQIAG